MKRGRKTEWLDDFGLADRASPQFVSTEAELDASNAAQVHVLRRAFDKMGIDGVLSVDNAPAIFFKSADDLDEAAEAKILALFWNQGVAPILVLIDATEVRVYSGLTSPAANNGPTGAQPDAVEVLSRAADVLQPFVRSVETGQYFQRHSSFFDPEKRVDRELLRNLRGARASLAAVNDGDLGAFAIDALLCRLVFTCYLFDRGVIDQRYLADSGIDAAAHLTDILGRKDAEDARADLYDLFRQLAKDFNGDLFADDLEDEEKHITSAHIDIVNGFFRGRTESGQNMLWGYDFSVIPIETISAIYEHFLDAEDPVDKHKSGAFYTPRFLAEFVLDRTLAGCDSALDLRFLDPACGSGIFLVGLFNRMAEEWRRLNPDAKYDRTATQLQKILTTKLYGIDKNPTACRIAAFSLCLAFLDQLAPPEIRRLQAKGRFIPRLASADANANVKTTTIRCADFFDVEPDAFKDECGKAIQHDVVVGNPPWAATATDNSPAMVWCRERKLPVPGRQLANAFVWKAPTHVQKAGRICFLLPNGVLFNHSSPALAFQKRLFVDHRVSGVVNLADYRFFLFGKAKHAAVIITYAPEPAEDATQVIDYLAPKADWSATRAGLINVYPQDRWRLTLRQVLQDLAGDDGPQVWKRHMWATPRDWRLLDRLMALPRLHKVVGQPGAGNDSRWVIAEGFQPCGPSDKAISQLLPTRKFISAKSSCLHLVLVPDETTERESQTVFVRRGRSESSLKVFRGPHVLIGVGFTKVAFADFDVSFQHALRAIHGPDSDTDLLAFLAGYLRSPLAKYFFFHTSSNWAISRPKVHVAELLRLPFILPEHDGRNAHRRDVVRRVASIVQDTKEKVAHLLRERASIVRKADDAIRPLVYSYFDIDRHEQQIINDTLTVIKPSIQPTQSMPGVQTVIPSTRTMRDAYARTLSNMLNNWAKDEWRSRCYTVTEPASGLGVAVVEKFKRGSGQKRGAVELSFTELLSAARRIQRETAIDAGAMSLLRGLTLFHKDKIFIFKPLGQRFWTPTAAMNDADEIVSGFLRVTTEARG